jgi:queuine tRNA-ribosyltransferase
MERSIRWAERCRRAHGRPEEQSLFAIVQGGVHEDLRRRCVEALAAQEFPGYAIGGLSVGEPREEMLRVTAATAALLPRDRPRYLMGVGTPADILDAIRLGVDIFDCVMPTRNARNAQLFTSTGRLRMKNAAHASDPAPPDAACRCETCRTYSRAALRHFFKVGELTASTLATIHNLTFYQDLMAGIRGALREGRLDAFALPPGEGGPGAPS